MQAKEERLESTIHIINTLKSVNDTSLSDWQGVIGEELEEQREERAEREQAAMEQVASLAAKLGQIEATQKSTADIHLEIDALRRELSYAMAGSGVTLPLPRVWRTRPVVEVACPSCGAPVKYKQKTNVRSVKATKCSRCETRLVARYDEERGHYLTLRTAVLERIDCPNCGNSCEAEVDPVPGSGTKVACNSCGTELVVVRATDGIRVRVGGLPKLAPQAFSQELIAKIRRKLPVQPWPTGIHKSVATELGILPQVVSTVITKLIADGVFLPQVDGKVIDTPATVPLGPDGRSSTK